MKNILDYKNNSKNVYTVCYTDLSVCICDGCDGRVNHTDSNTDFEAEYKLDEFDSK